MNFIKKNFTNILLAIVILLLAMLLNRNEPLGYYETQQAIEDANPSIDYSDELEEIKGILEDVQSDVSWIKIWQ